jgi:hypothetical protein
MPQQINGQVWWTVQNRTDLMDTNNKDCIVSYKNSPNSFVPFQLPKVYAGETIPARAIMRLAGPMIFLADGEPVFSVCMPDDQSQAYQEAGIHFINGPTPIPVGKIGMGTKDLPALALWDWTAPGGVYSAQFEQSDSRYYVSGEMGIMSGSWALQTAGNVISANQSSTKPTTYWPFTRMSLQAIPDPNVRGKFSYDKSRVWVDRGTGVSISNPSGALAAAVNNLSTAIIGASV